MAPIEQILAAAVTAPSADNNQPWRFVTSEDSIRCCLDPRRALPSDVEGMFDLISLGAAIECARIAASGLGYQAVVDIHCHPRRIESPEGEFDEFAVIEWEPGAQTDSLLPHLKTRCTNRSAYSRRSVPDAVLATLYRSIDAFPMVRVDFSIRRAAIRRLAALIARSDRVRFEHKPFHAELFRQLRFSQEAVRNTRDGLDVRTLGLPPGAGLLLGCLRSWSLTSLLHRLRLSWLLALPTAFSVWRSGAVGAITVGDRSRESFIEGGRALQRLWLTAQSQGLSLQPMGSLPIFMAMLHSQANALPEQKQARIQELEQQFYELTAADRGRALIMLFRLGYARVPQHRSLRRSSDEFLLVDTSVNSVEEGADVYVQSAT